VLRVRAVFADIEEHARIGIHAAIDEIHGVENAVGAPRVIRGEGITAQVQILCGRAFRRFAFLLDGQVGEFLFGQIAAGPVFYFHFHDALLIDSLDTAPDVVRQDALSGAAAASDASWLIR